MDVPKVFMVFDVESIGGVMRIRRRPSGFWHIEVPGWTISVKLTRARWGYHRISHGAFSWGTPFATGNVIRRADRP